MNPRRFRIAFSFAGEKRTFVADVAKILADRFGEAAILYDKYHEAEFARRDLGIYLPELYHKESDLIVVVICPDYKEKEWTGLEWAAIHDLLKKRKDDEVMLCRFGHSEVSGLYSTAGFIQLDHKTPEQTANHILERLALNEGQAKDHYAKHSPSGAALTSRGPLLRRWSGNRWVVIALLLMLAGVTAAVIFAFSPKAKSLSLRELFDSDFSQYLRIKNQMGFASSGSEQTNVVNVSLVQDYTSQSEFLAFYIPNTPQTFQLCEILSREFTNAISVSKGGVRIEVKDLGVERGTESKQLEFSRRVFVYHEYPLSTSEKDSLQRSYSARGLTLLLRGGDYALSRSLPLNP